MNNNPAKAYLRRYRSALKRAESLQRAIDEAHSRAMSITMELKPDKVQGSGAHDMMENAVIQAAEASEALCAELAKAKAVLTEILTAIGAVQDETQKAVLTLRYVEGLDWISVSERIGYEERQTFVYHGRGLMAVRRWMEKSAG